jgi:peptide/nickel transport system permease protein
MLRLSSADPAAIIAGDNATTEEIQDIRVKLGLDQPVLVQFGVWLTKVSTGNLGESFFFKKQVSELILDRLEPTLSLALCTIILSVMIAVPLGVLAAYYTGTWIDRLVMGLAVLGFSIPVFVVGYLLMYVFSLELSWLPVQGYQRLSEGFWGWLQKLLLPCFALSAVYCALIARITRTSVQEVLGEDYIRTAHAKGLTNKIVLMRHALRNAAVPIVTVIGIGVALLISGVVITETVFNIPGLGRLTVDAVLKRDYPIVQGLILVFAAAKVLVNLMIDISYAFLDPRIRY